MFNALNFDALYGDPANITATGPGRRRVPLPERGPNREPHPHATFGLIGGVNYGFCMGDWYVWGGLDAAPRTARHSASTCSRPWAAFRDGTEPDDAHGRGARTTSRYFRDCGGAVADQRPGQRPPARRRPARRRARNIAAAAAASCQRAYRSGPRAVHHTGFTTAWPPNKRTPGGPAIGQYRRRRHDRHREQIGGPTFSAITSRSYHPGGVNALFGDGASGSSRDVNGVWRGLGTVAGGEVVSADAY